jgi:hypothetical protein
MTGLDLDIPCSSLRLRPFKGRRHTDTIKQPLFLASLPSPPAVIRPARFSDPLHLREANNFTASFCRVILLS